MIISYYAYLLWGKASCALGFLEPLHSGVNPVGARVTLRLATAEQAALGWAHALRPMARALWGGGVLTVLQGAPALLESDMPMPPPYTVIPLTQDSHLLTLGPLPTHPIPPPIHWDNPPLTQTLTHSPHILIHSPWTLPIEPTTPPTHLTSSSTHPGSSLTYSKI